MLPLTKDLREHVHRRARAVADLIHRSFAGPIGNVLGIGVLLFGTDLLRDHPWSTGLFAGILALRLVVRVVLTIMRRPDSASSPQFPLWLIGLSAYTLSAPTGLYASFVIRHYGLGDLNTLLLCLFVIACSISGANALAPDFRIGIGYQLSLLLPIALTSLWANDRHAVVAGVSLLMFTVYVLIQSARQNKDYQNVVATDLALRSRAEELQTARIAADAASRAKSQFLVNMSHEIRTPMNGVLGMLELALRGDLSADQRQQLGYARESAHLLLELLNDLLDHSKAEAGRLDLEQTDFAVDDLVRGSFDPFLAQAAEKGIDLSVVIAPDVPRFLKGDPTRMRQIAINLVSNAVKFTERGSIRVRVGVDSSREGTVLMHLLVADTGPGIAPDKQEVIFGAFSQGDGSITRRYGGTGLGLAICRDLVKLMGGRIWVESELGRGSTFHVTAECAVSSGVDHVDAPAEPVLPAAEPLRVLVAEDNLINQKVLTRVLKIGGHSFEIVENGEQAVSRFSRDGFDLILMDVQMPGMDGLEATRRIRDREGTGPHLPIVGVTAGATVDEVTACLASGMDACITKPIVIHELEQLLARVSAGLPPVARSLRTAPGLSERGPE